MDCIFALVVAGILLDAFGKTLRMLMFPGIIQPMSPGVTPDTMAEYGILAMMSNLNAHALTPQASIATAGTNTTLTAQQVYNGVIILTAGASGGFTITLPSTASILYTIPTNGTYCALMFIQNNNVAQTGTVTAGDASTTLSGTMTIATNTTRWFLLSVTSNSTITITNVGSLTL